MVNNLLDKPFLVHVHIYYTDMYEEIKESLSSISGYKYDLFFTFVKEYEELFSKIKNDFPSAKIEVVDNLGFDVGPFIHILNSVDLDKYSYIIKVHTKRNLSSKSKFGINSGSKWRMSLLSFLKDKSTFNNIISRLEKNDKIGMHGSNKLIFNKYTDPRQTRNACIDFLKQNNLPVLDFNFVAGTMFVVKAELFKELVNLSYTIKDFESPDLSHEGCQLAHVYERLFGYFVAKKDKQIVDCTTNMFFSSIQYYFVNFVRVVTPYIFSIRLTKRNVLLIKVFKIPVFFKKMK